MQSFARLNLAAAACLALAAPAAVAIEPGPPRSRRLVQIYDFEERHLGNYEQMPRYWFALGRDPEIADPTFHGQPVHGELIGRPGYPGFTEVRFDKEHATSGEHALYLGLNGGSAGAFLQNGALPAVPDSDYLITARVRTELLQRAAARLIAYFVDGSGQRVETSVVRSTPLRTGGKWTTVALRLIGDHSGADYIVIEVQLRQPQADPADPLGDQQVVIKDVQGRAWFDDIAVWQLPHVEVATQSPVNIVRAPQKPRLSIIVRDLTAQRLHVDLEIYDHAMRSIGRQRRPVGGGHPNKWGWTPDLPGFGWYLVDLKIFESAARTGTPVARSIGAFLWVPEQRFAGSSDVERFVLVAEGLPPPQLQLVPDLLAATDLGVAVVSAWDRDTTLSNLVERQDMLDEIVFAVRGGGGSVVMSLDPIPMQLARAQGVDASSPLAVLQADEQSWMPYVAPVLLRHGQRVGHWVLGAVDRSEAFFYADLPRIIEQIDRRFRALAPAPRLVLPWSAGHGRRADVAARSKLIFALDMPAGITPARIADAMESWQSPPAPTWLVLRSPPADEVAHPGRVTDLLLRMIYGWEQRAAALAIHRPWTRADERREALLPDPLLGVFTNAAHLLAGRRVVGRLPLIEGLECLILDGPAGGMLVAWNSRVADDVARLEMYLGESPEAIDAWGNRSPVPMSRGKHLVELQKTPVFIEGIDAKLALLRAGFSVDPPFIESKQQPHDRTIRLSNPWPRTIRGRFHILGPSGSRTQPPRHDLAIPAGGSVSLPVTLSFPVSEVAGRKQLRARFEFTADRQYLVDLDAPMRLGLEDVNFDANVAVEPGAAEGTTDLVVVTLVTNTGTEAGSLYVFASVSGHPRQELPLSQLSPGQTVLRSFRFMDVGDVAPTTSVRAGVRQTNGPAVLNFKVDLEQVK